MSDWVLGKKRTKKGEKHKFKHGIAAFCSPG